MPLRQHSRSLSLEAFQDLITQRASLVTEYLSLQVDSTVLSPPESVYELHYRSHKKPTDPSTWPGSLRDGTRRRSIATVSDCSDDDVRKDEGWIPIAWRDSSYSIPSPHIISHKRSMSWYSTTSSSYTEVFSGEDCTPPMTPVSPDFDTQAYERLNKVPNDAYFALHGQPTYIDDTTRWILDSDNVY